MSGRIHEIEFENFKGIRSFDVQNLGQINVFFGKNNAGKSSVLHALSVMGSVLKRNPHRPETILARQLQDLFPDPEKFSLTLMLERRIKLGIKVSRIRNDQGAVEFEIQDLQNYKNRIRTIYIEPSLDVGNTHQQSPPYGSILQQFKDESYRNFNGLQLFFALKSAAEQGHDIYKVEDYQVVQEALITYFPELKSIDSFRDDTDIARIEYLEEGTQNRLDIIYSGNGLKSFLDILIKFKLSKAHIVLLDEPERGLHPDQQRKLAEFIITIANNEDVQFFISTHSPIFFNYPEKIQYYRLFKSANQRHAAEIPREALSGVLYDFGLRPSDVFNADITVFVEGPTDVIFFEHVILHLYKEAFSGVVINIRPTGGSSILNSLLEGTVQPLSITGTNNHVLWILDKDAPSGNNTLAHQKPAIIKGILEGAGMGCWILEKREVEYYIPIELYQSFQGQDRSKITAVTDAFQKQEKFRACQGFTKPRKSELKEKLPEFLDSQDKLEPEIKNMVEAILLPWKEEILS